MVDYRVSDVVIAPVDFRCCFPAEIAINALVVHVEAARNVVGVAFVEVSHGVTNYRQAGPVVQQRKSSRPGAVA